MNAMKGSPQNIYLDHNATAPILPRVVEAMATAYSSIGGNPASQHRCGQKARQILEDARDEVAALLGARSGAAADRVIFTSGGTEANNLALFGLAGAQPAHAIVSAIEHPSLAGPAEELRRRGWEIELLPVGRDGIVDLARLPELLRSSTRFVSLMLANNETGALQPVARAAQICMERGISLHTDAVQAVGKISVDFAALGVSALSLSAHKFHGPPGIGALVLRHGTRIEPLQFGGFQQAGLRPGTEPVALAVGMSTALSEWHAVRESTQATLANLRDEFETSLRAGWPDLIVNAAAAARLPHTSNVSFPGLDRQALVMALDLAGISCSTGSACASGSSEPSPVLVAMGCSETVFQSALRFSLGRGTTRAEITEASDRILKVCNKLREGKLGQKIPLGGRREGSILVD